MATAVIGNSHAKVIRHAPNTIAHNPIDVQAYYFVRSDWKSEPLGPDGQGPLRLSWSPPHEEDEGFVLQGYDDLVLSAGGWWAAHHIFDIGRHPLSWVALAGWGDISGRAPDTVRVVSAAVFQATVEAWVRDQAVMRLTSHLLDVTASRIFLQPWPAPNRAVKSDPDWALNRWYGERAPAVWRAFFLAQLQALKAIAAEFGPRLVLLDYPLAEVFEDGYMDGSMCNPDPFHANAAYGALVVNQIAALMD